MRVGTSRADSLPQRFDANRVAFFPRVPPVNRSEHGDSLSLLLDGEDRVRLATSYARHVNEEVVEHALRNPLVFKLA
jgi:hypothetical protein